MDKLDIIIEKLNSLERIESDIRALKSDNKEMHKKLDKLDAMIIKQDMTWQAVQELKDELTNNSLKIKIIDNKVKAL